MTTNAVRSTTVESPGPQHISRIDPTIRRRTRHRNRPSTGGEVRGRGDRNILSGIHDRRRRRQSQRTGPTGHQRGTDGDALRRGHLSGGHYNPAVTLAALIRPWIGPRDALAYWLSQIGAGLFATPLVRTVIDPTQPAAAATLTLNGPTLLAAFVVELLFTFALCYVVLNVATSKDHPTNSFYGLAIGFTVRAGAVAVGGISGGAFNPGVTFAGAVMGIFAWPTPCVYLVAQVIAGAAAGLTFLALNSDDK
jgi:aquaporin Z